MLPNNETDRTVLYSPPLILIIPKTLIVCLYEVNLTARMRGKFMGKKYTHLFCPGMKKK